MDYSLAHGLLVEVQAGQGSGSGNNTPATITEVVRTRLLPERYSHAPGHHQVLGLEAVSETYTGWRVEEWAQVNGGTLRLKLSKWVIGGLPGLEA